MNFKSGWTWLAGLIGTAAAGTAVVLLRGCWHRKMSWPVRAHGYSYQVCLGCGIKRLFDEREFIAFGPYSYEIERLVAWDRKQQAVIEPGKIKPSEQRPA